MPDRTLNLGTLFSANADQFIRETDKILNRVKRIQNTFNRMGRAAKGFQQVEQAVKKTDQALTQHETKVKKVTGSVGKFQAAWGRVTSALKTSAAFGVAGSAIYAVVSALKAGVKEIFDYDTALKNLQAITKATDNEVLAMGETIKQVATDTKFSTGEVADGMVLLGQAGFSATESMQAMASVANLATGTLSSLELASDLLTTTVRAFNLETVESARVADVMANAINRSKLTIDKLRIAFNFVGAAAAQTGLSLEETAASMMVLANNGIRASTIGTGLRQVLSRLLAPNRRLREEFEAQGIELDKVNPKTQGFQVAMENLLPVLTDATGKTVDMGKAYRLFGLRGAQAAAILTKAFLSGDYRRMLDQTYEAGSAAEMAAIQMESLGVKFKNLADRAKLIFVALGEGGVTSVLKVLIDALRVLAKVTADFLSSGVGQIIVEFIAWTAAGWGVIKMLNILIPLIVKGSKAMLLLYGNVGKAIANMKLLMLGVTSFAAKWKILIATISFGNPWLLLAAAIAAVLVAFKQWYTATDRALEETGMLQAELQTTAQSLQVYAAALEEIKKKHEDGDDVQRRHAATIQRIKQQFEELKDVLDENVDSLDGNIKAVQEYSKLRTDQMLDLTIQRIELYNKKLDETVNRQGKLIYFWETFKSFIGDIGNLFLSFGEQIMAWIRQDIRAFEKLFNYLADKLPFIGKIFGALGKAMGWLEDRFKTIGERMDEYGRNSKEAKKVTEEMKNEYIKLAKTFKESRPHFSTAEILEGIKSLGASEEILEEVGKALDADKIKIAEMASTFKKDMAVLPDVFKEFYDNLDLLGKANFAKVKDQMEREVAAFRDKAKLLTKNEGEMYAAIAAIRAKHLVKFIQDNYKEEMSAKELHDLKIRMLDSFAEKEKELSSERIKIIKEDYKKQAEAVGDNYEEQERLRNYYQGVIIEEDKRLAETLIGINEQKNAEIESEERRHFEERAELVEEMTNEIIAQTKKEVDAARSKYDQLRQDAKDAEANRLKDLRDIRQTAMTEEQKLTDDQAYLQEVLNQAREKSDKAYYEEALSLARGLARTVKDENGKVIQTAEEGAELATRTYENIFQEYQQFLTNQSEVARRELANAENRLKDLEQALKEYKETLDAVSLRKLELQTGEAIARLKTTNQEATAIKSKWDAIQSKTVTLTIKVKRVDGGGGGESKEQTEKTEEAEEEKMAGGLVGAYKRGGLVIANAIKRALRGFQEGGKLPGYGGGDRIPILAEAGEFIMKKESVQKYGTAFMEAINNMTADLTDVGAQMTAKLGGMVKKREFAGGGAVQEYIGEIGTRPVINVTLAPNFLTGDRVSMRTAAVEIRRALVDLGVRWGAK